MNIFLEFLPNIHFLFKNLVFTGGIRADYHNVYGTFITPRFHAKYSPDDLFTLNFQQAEAHEHLMQLQKILCFGKFTGNNNA